MTQAEGGGMRGSEAASLLEALDSAAALTDCLGIVTGWNARAEELYGWQASEALGRPIVDLVVPVTSRDAAMEALRSVADGAVWTGDFLVQRKDGGVFLAYVHDAPVRGPDGTITGILGLSRDVTTERMETHAVREREAFEQLAAGASPAVVAIARVNANGLEFLYRNPQWSRYTGESDELRAPSPLVHPDDLDEDARARMREQLVRGRSVDIEARFRGQQGDYRRFRFRLSPIEDSLGGPGLVTIVGTDVDARRRAAELARQREGVLRQLADAIPALLVVAVPDEIRGTRPIFFNQRWLEYTGFDEATLLGPEGRHALYHPDDRARIPALRERATADHAFEGDFRFRRHDGDYRWHHVVHQPVRDHGDEEPGLFVTIAVDVHGARMVEAQVQRLAAIVNSSDDAIIGKTLDGTITSWNDGAAQLYGYSAEEAIGANIALIVPEESQNELLDILTRLAAGERVAVQQTERVRKDGRRVPVSLTVSPVLDSGGEVVGASAIARDRTAEHRLIEALRRANAVKDEFLGLVSHELRSPLTTVVGLSTILSRRVDQVSPEIHEAHVDLYRESVRLQAIIENMLALARADDPDALEPVALGPLLRRTIARFRERVPDAEVLLNFPGDAPLAIGQAGWIEQIVENLLSNAEKYGAAGTTEVSVHPVDDELSLGVRDHGPGIPESEVAEIFEPFFRGTATRSKPGVGLGLAVCRRLAEVMGGTISARTAEGGGAVFEVRLKAWTEDPADAP